MSKQVTNDDKVIGSRLRSLRVAAGFTQEKLGDALGVTFQQIQKYEHGTNRIAGSRLLAVCDVLQTTPNVLLAIKGNGKQGAEVAVDIINDTAMRKVLMELLELEPRKRAAVAIALKRLVEAFA